MAARTKNTNDTTTEEVTDDTPKILVKDLCEELNAEPKAFRRWLRTQTTERAGRGGRWVFDADTAEALKEKYRNRAKDKETTPTIDADES